MPEYGTGRGVDLIPDDDSGNDVSGGQRLGEGLSSRVRVSWSQLL